GDTGGVHGGAFTEDEDGAVAPLIVQGEAGRRGNGGVAVAQGDGLEVVVHPLPELAFTVIGLGLIEARELRVHVHDLLSVGVLWRGDRLDDPYFARLPAIVGVPVRGVVEVNDGELGVALGLGIPRRLGGVGHHQQLALAEQFVLRVPAWVRVEDLDIVRELIGAANRVHPGAAGQATGTPYRFHVGPGVFELR